MKWNPISEAPKRSGVYFVYAPSADPNSPFFYVAYYSTDHGWSGLARAWLKALSHWMEPVPPTPFDHGSFEAMDDESRVTAIRAEQAKRTKSPTVIKDLQGDPLDLRDVEVETLILNATPAQRKHLKHIGRQAIRGMLGMEDESTATGTEIRAGVRLVAQESADNLKKHLP